MYCIVFNAVTNVVMSTVLGTTSLLCLLTLLLLVNFANPI